MLSAVVRVRLSILALAAILCVLATATPERAGAAAMTFVVNQSDTILDPGDGVCDSHCTLRDAIIAANANPGHDTISFDPAGSVYSIEPGTTFPPISGKDGITIDGTGSDVNIYGFEVPTASHGLNITTAVGEKLHDVIVRNIRVNGFGQSGIRFCAGASAAVCTYDASDILLENVNADVNSDYGIEVRAASVTGLTAKGVVAAANGKDGIYLNVAGNLVDLEMTSSEATGNIDRGLEITAANITNVEFTDSAFNDNGYTAMDLHAMGNMSNVSLTGVDWLGNQSLSDLYSGGGTAGVTMSEFKTESAISIGGATVADVSLTDSSFNGKFLIGVPFSIVASGDISGILISNNEFSNQQSSLVLATESGDISDASVSDNSFSGDGVAIGAATVNNVDVIRNTIHDSVHNGVALTLKNGGSDNVVRENEILGSKLDGISVRGTGTVTLSRNTVYDSGQLAIDLVKPGEPNPGVTLNDAGDADTGPNGLLNFPVITGDNPQGVSGSTCPNCKVELFAIDTEVSGYGESREFLTDGMANQAGHFFISVCDPTFNRGGIEISATATDPQGNTSELALNYALTAFADLCPTATPSPSPSTTPTSPTPTPGPGRKQGDVDCDGQVTPRDALILLLVSKGFPSLSRSLPCPSLGSGQPRFGDANCDGIVDELDAAAVLRFAGSLPPLAQMEPCTDIGST